MSYEIIEYHDIPNSLAKKILEKYVANLRGGVSEIVKVTLEYLDKVEKCDYEKIDYMYNELKKLGFKEVTISMILNIVPKSIDELRTLLVFEEKIPDDDVLKTIIDMILNNCKE
ncbi:hypothetical protein QPL79_09020 [Ignisphaera sp. 4213-co]|uniref:DNA-directed RNA polymerase subunit Rpo4 n=1 Tax=Ignisphaera cupida TaxID=3050454 RepID=A0ABD4Z8D5_9CREN|nr:hypothetical protein [Ignisphaera sp. 4213-co]MDK6029504.1 hypothetical protein [Ignisphaera sp. 4213-co]